MNIQMIGIDHSTADVKIRERFSFTVSQAERAMQYLKQQPGIKGCVLLSTCNRMELYVSTEDLKCDLLDMIGEIKQLPEGMEQFRKYFTDRHSKAAVEHLFYLTAGLKSKILGEDQILTQVKDAVAKSREQYCTDSLLEVLFRYAVTAGKEVKTKTPSVHADFSAAHCAIAGLKQQGYVWKGKKCLVIGNGHMGKIAAQALQEEGAKVTVTVRQYRSGMVEIPIGCDRIHYGERYAWIPDCDLVLSATVSPNLTIRKEPLQKALGEKCRQQIYIDLAVPRDIEEEITQIAGVTLYDIDSFQTDETSMPMRLKREMAQNIIKKKLSEFWDWYECRELVPRIQQIGKLASEDICWRMGQKMGHFSKEEQKQIQAAVKESSHKVIDKLFYALRDALPREELYHCIEILEQIEE